MKKSLFLFFLFALFVQHFEAQMIYIPVHKDTVKLTVPSTTGVIQWQKSNDSLNWQNIVNATQTSFNYVVNTTELPLFFRASISVNNCPLEYSSVQSIRTDMPTYYWSDPLAWQNNTVPKNGDSPLIPNGRRIILDVSSAQLSGLTINGVLQFMEKDLSLTSDYIALHGVLQIGSPKALFQHKATITLTGSTSQNIMGMGSRGILVMGGKLELHGLSPKTFRTKINTNASRNATQLSVIQNFDWKIEDEIVLAPTDYFGAANGNSVSQRLTITGINNSIVQVQQGLNAQRWGLLQYATLNGLSLDSTNRIAPHVADTLGFSVPTILDERATIGHLTRNILIQAPDDDLWKNAAFGAHIMIMSANAEAHINGVEIKRAGQRGRLGRYPFHWHMLSYSGTQALADATGQYFMNSVIEESKNRGVVIHGTNGVLVKNNVLFDIEGHGIFTEDAVERRNTIDSNVVLKVRNPQIAANLALKQHEVGGRGSSGFWISNPDNVVTNNLAADCGTNGFWLAFPEQPWGESASVLASDGLLLNPSRLLFGVFDRNVAHSNGQEGIMLDFVEINNRGEVYPNQYQSTTTGRTAQYPFSTLRRFTLSRYEVWKNTGNGIWDRARRPNNFGVVSADNCGRFFAGSGDDGLISHTLAIGTSLNHNQNNLARPQFADFSSTYGTPDPAGFATYHSTFDIKNNIAINFPGREATRSGVFSTDDYYLRPVDKGQLRNKNNRIIQSHPGVKLSAAFPYFSQASALWDPHGVWGPAGNFVVFDVPFLTYGKNASVISPNTTVSGGVSVPGPFYGFEGFVLHGVGDTPPKNQPYFDLMGIQIDRLDQNFNKVGEWYLPEAAPNQLLQHMRHFATSPDSYYVLNFPQEDSLPTDFQVNVENFLDSTDTQVIAISFNGKLDANVEFRAYGRVRTFSALSTRNEVINSNGFTFWQDKTNNLVWVKLRGGFWQFWTTNPNEAIPEPDEILYETTVLRIH